MAAARVFPASSISRRQAVAGLGAAGFGLAVNRAAAQSATPVSGAHPLAGAWFVTGSGPIGVFVAAIYTFSTDGLAVASDVRGVVQAGAWAPEGAAGAVFTLVAVLPDDNRNLGQVVTIHGRVKATDGQTFSAAGTYQSADPTGAPMELPKPFTVEGKRISAQGPA